MSSAKPEIMWAVVELFGHARIAGAISEQTFGGSSFVRVDVPEVRYQEVDYDADTVDGSRPRREHVIQAHTRSFGPAAIYSINWCDEAAARVAAQEIRHKPLQPYSLREALASMGNAQRALLLER